MPEESEISRRKVINSVLPTERDRDYDPPSGDANGKREASWESVEKEGGGGSATPCARDGIMYPWGNSHTSPHMQDCCDDKFELECSAVFCCCLPRLSFLLHHPASAADTT